MIIQDEYDVYIWVCDNIDPGTTDEDVANAVGHIINGHHPEFGTDWEGFLKEIELGD